MWWFDRCAGRRGGELDGLDALHVRELLLEHALHAVRQGHLGHRAAAACALEAHLHDATFDTDQLDVAAIGLQRRPDLVEYRLDLLVVHVRALPHVPPKPLRAGDGGLPVPIVAIPT